MDAMITAAEIQGAANMTQEMKKLLIELLEIINYSRDAGRPVQRITLSRKQWEPIRKDRKRASWKEPRPCGLIHYEKEEPTFDGVRLGAPGSRELEQYIQEEAFR